MQVRIEKNGENHRETVEKWAKILQMQERIGEPAAWGKILSKRMARSELKRNGKPAIFIPGMDRAAHLFGQGMG